RFATLIALCGTTALAGWVAVGFVGTDSTGSESLRATYVTAQSEPATVQTSVVAKNVVPAVAKTEISPAAAAEVPEAAATVAAAAVDQPEPAAAPAAESASAGASPLPPTEDNTTQVATASLPESGQDEDKEAVGAPETIVGSLETMDECLV